MKQSPKDSEMQIKKSTSAVKDSQVSSARRRNQVVADEEDQVEGDEEVKNDQEMQGVEEQNSAEQELITEKERERRAKKERFYEEVDNEEFF